jgi:hypothetical protein
MRTPTSPRFLAANTAFTGDPNIARATHPPAELGAVEGSLQDDSVGILSK